VNLFDNLGKASGRSSRQSSVERAIERMAHVVAPAREAGPPAPGTAKMPAPAVPAAPIAPVASAAIAAAAVIEAPRPAPAVEPAAVRAAAHAGILAEPRVAVGPKAPMRTINLDFEQMRFGGFSTSSRERTQVAEEFRLVKRPLLLNAFQKGPNAIRHGNMIMVSSSRSGEGKTFCAVSLALSMAYETDLTVMLIDADVAKPDVPRVLGFEADRGLVDVAADPSLDISDVMLKTNVENLTVVPAGRPHPHATELLASDRMGRIFDELSERYSNRVIVIDSPPVLMSSVGGVLALHVGQILFVVEADRTSQGAVDQSLALVKACKNISLLLNKNRALGTERFGAYNYYYR
jgi:receptor protein-tyrosine kinase